MDEIKKEFSKMLTVLESITPEDEELVRWKIADLKKDLIQIKIFVNDIKDTLEIHKKIVANRHVRK